MTEEQHRKWDIIIKGIITPIIAVITVFAGIYQYTDGQKRSLEKEFDLRKIERQEQFREEKTALYKEARRVVSFLSTNDMNSDLYESKKIRFWELYWGDLAAVESSKMESLMVKFGRLLENLENEQDQEDKISTRKLMKEVSLTLARQTSEELNVD